MCPGLQLFVQIRMELPTSVAVSFTTAEAQQGTAPCFDSKAVQVWSQIWHLHPLNNTGHQNDPIKSQDTRQHKRPTKC